MATDAPKTRLDRFLASEVKELSRSKIQRLIFSGCVRVNSVVVTDANHNIKCDDEISMDDDFREEKPDITADGEVKFSVLYEDEDLLVIHKPAGVVVHPGAGNLSHTLVNGLAHHCGESLSSGSDPCRPGIVHRIDKDTSGILVVAKNDFSHGKLAKQFAVHSIKRKYVCFCHGNLLPLHGKIETLIARDKNNRRKMAVSSHGGRNAVTLYKTLRTFSKFASKVECELRTGRTHQIRVHMAHKGCSLVGDSLYREKNYFVPKCIADFIRLFPRQALHAYSLEFVHPRSRKPMLFESDLPADLMELERRMDLEARKTL